MNTTRSLARRKEEGVANERIHPCGDQVPLVEQEEVNKEVPHQETQVPL